jgi:hypothetical protein
MGTNLDPRISNPQRRYKADGSVKGQVHRPDPEKNFMRNAGPLFGESPNLREKK